MDFKVSLRMSTYRAHFRSLGAHDNVSAVATLPNFDIALFENLFHLYIIKKLPVAFFMCLFNRSNTPELFCKFLEPFFIRILAMRS